MSAENSPRVRSGSESEREVCDDRPERMRDWLLRMIDSGRFQGLEWLDDEKTIFRVPWIHAKKRGYCRERDAALFREWALHSGKYRDESDPTVWKINFRCAINGLKDITELKEMQTEDCRVYKVLPSRSRRRPRRQRYRSNADPYPTPVSYPSEGKGNYQYFIGVLIKIQNERVKIMEEKSINYFVRLFSSCTNSGPHVRTTVQCRSHVHRTTVHPYPEAWIPSTYDAPDIMYFFNGNANHKAASGLSPQLLHPINWRERPPQWG